MPQQNPVVLAKVSELLKTEDDLAKVEALTRNLRKEKSTIDSQIKIEEERGMDSVQRMINQMQAANKHLKELGYSVQKLDDLQKDSTSNSEVSAVFDRAATALKNLTDVEEIYNGFKTLEEKMNLIEALMAIELPEGSDYYSETSSGDNLLIIHYELTALRDFRDKIIALGMRSSPDVQQAVDKSFDRLDKLIDNFDYMLSLVVDGFIDIIGCENYGLVIKLVKIIQYEANEDLKFQLLDKIMNMKQENEVVPNTSLNVKRSEPRRYMEKFENDFQSTINASFKNLAEDSEYGQMLKLLDENYYDTLGVYSDAVEKCFPSEWHFFDKILSWNQSSLRKIFLKMLEDQSVANSVIVQILNFEYENKKKLKEIFHISKEQLKIVGIITDAKKDELLESCLKFNNSKTDEWIKNSLKSSITLFQTRTKEPPDSKDEKLGIESAQMVVEILRSNIHALAELGDSKVMLKYLDFFASKIMKYYYDLWNHALDDEVKKWTLPENGKEDDKKEIDPTIGYMPRYITVLANDCVKLVDALDSQFGEVKKLVHASFHEQVDEIAGRASGYAIDLGIDCLKKLNGFIVVEYQPFLSEVFSKQWYKSSSMIELSLQIVDESYMGPLQEFLQQELYISLFEIVFDQYLLSYLNALFLKHSIREDKFADRIERDGNLIQQTFSNYDTAGIIGDQLYILDILINISTCDHEDEFIEQWKSAVEVFNDLPIDFLQIILDNKGIRDSKENSVLERCLAISKQFAVANGDNQAPTFMSDFHFHSARK
ncbi:hypothetical protein FOA43_003714 [Brettanomyces nanus]|uniref:Exocyst complex component Sec6 n=1 Tax=Eeniella nana TaxID=13502 RepID=A0A875S5V0_EENNA|nr:uncharacterized protein FOA43_003714 [Brettanomyces nanus]QPG76328.1 hypothetical protein FOA43_003714 [Brettanomyces nanus]